MRLALLLAPLLGAAVVSGYHSPYAVRFTMPVAELNAGLDVRVAHLCPVPAAQWYSASVRREFGAWGPRAGMLPAPEGLAQHDAEWKRERVIAAALRFQGYTYQHHHLPDWDPPAGWPWTPTKVGHNAKGVDCSNMVSVAYDLALGIQPDTNVHRLAVESVFPGPGGQRIAGHRIEKPASYRELTRTLQTGDLLFVKHSPAGEVSHVVLWVGAIGQAPDGAPLVLDSHGAGVMDSAGAEIPCGVQLRPFREASWYWTCASHAMRIVE